MNAAVYARVSTLDQEPENQLQELRRYIEARGWQATEFIDKGVSGARESRPALDTLVKDARRRRFDTLAVWRLDRLGRNLRHLILLLDELTALGVAFVSLNEGIDTSTPAGRLQLHILGAIAEFERARIQERVRAGLARARAQGQHLGRPRVRIAPERLQEVAGLTVAEAAAALRVSPATLKRLRRSSKSSAISLEISARFRWVRCPAHPDQKHLIVNRATVSRRVTGRSAPVKEVSLTALRHHLQRERTLAGAPDREEGEKGSMMLVFAGIVAIGGVAFAVIRFRRARKSRTTA